MDDGEDGFDVGAGGDFGDDAAVGLVEVDLGDDDVAQDFGAVLHYGGGGFVTAGFDAEDFQRFASEREHISLSAFLFDDDS